MELQAQISIKRPLDDVWDCFTNPDKWKDWWGGALTRVDPKWEKGANLVWGMGRPSTILNLTPAKEIEIGNAWSNTTWYFTKEKRDSTLIVYRERFTGGASMDPRTWQADTASTLSKLKQCVERMPSLTRQPSKMEEPSGSGHLSWLQRLLGKGRGQRAQAAAGASPAERFPRPSIPAESKQAEAAAAAEAVDRQADMWREMGFQVGGVEAAKEAARKAAAARPSEAWFDEAVDKMVSVYRGHPQGFVQGSGGPPEQELRRIGEMLNERGGMDLMRAAHAEFASKCGVVGAARNLEFVWDGIGSWMG